MFTLSVIMYIGVTSDIVKRVYQHRNNRVKGFSSKYKLHKLLYYEVFDDSYEAIKREKQLKNWHRDWKLNLIKEFNSSFKDLYEDIL